MEAPRPPGSLSVYDLGYFNLSRFRELAAAGAYWISRAVWRLNVLTDTAAVELRTWLAEQTRTGQPVDQWVEVGTTECLHCRVVALQAPQEVVARRRQKAYAKAAKEGRQPTAAYLESLAWTVYLTNARVEKLTWQAVIVLYRVRWPIELLFKLWKSHNQLANHRSNDPVRQLVELYARLIAAIVQHGLWLTTCWSDERTSLVKATAFLRETVLLWIGAFGSVERLAESLRTIAAWLAEQARIDSRSKRPSSFQLLTDPEVLPYEP